MKKNGTFYKCNNKGTIFEFMSSRYIGSNNGFRQSHIVLNDSRTIIYITLKYLENNFTLLKSNK